MSEEKKTNWVRKHPILSCLIVLVTFIIIVEIFEEKNGMNTPSTPTSWSCSYDVKEYIKTYYKSPSTVEFVSCNYQISWNTMTIVWEADSQNWFGATVRSSFKCVEDSIAKTTNCNIIEQ